MFNDASNYFTRSARFRAAQLPVFYILCSPISLQISLPSFGRFFWAPFGPPKRRLKKWGRIINTCHSDALLSQASPPQASPRRASLWRASLRRASGSPNGLLAAENAKRKGPPASQFSWASLRAKSGPKRRPKVQNSAFIPPSSGQPLPLEHSTNPTKWNPTK